MTSPGTTMTMTWLLAIVLLTGTLGAAPPDPELDEAFGLAHQAIKDQRNLAEPTFPEGMSHVFDQQTRNLQTTEELLAINNLPHEDDLHRAVTLAQAGTKWQAATLGLEWVEPVPLDGHSAPSPALLELADRHGVEPSADQLVQIESLDDLDEPLRLALARFVDAFLALDTAARLAYQDADLASLEDLQDLHEPQDPPDVLNRPEGDFIPGSILNDAGIELSLVFPTRNQFLDAILDLHEALAAIPTGGCRAVALAPVFSISIGGCDETYNQSYALGLDTGGSDRHHNNAGGNSLSADDCSVFRGAAALVDLSSSDEYGDPTNPRGCGANGGGYLGVGFLFDADGSDVYTAASDGTNGGGNLGVGFLVDAGGGDTYTAGSFGTNGGGSGGVGFLLDSEGNDRYTASDRGTNGGGNLGVGYLFDGAGTDLFVDPAIPGSSCWDCSIIPKGEIGAQVDEALSVPDLQARIVSIAKLIDIGTSEAQTATITIESGLFRASAIGTFADLPILVPLLSGEPHPDNLNHDLGVASTSYTHQEDVCIDGQCAFNVGASLGDDVKIGELWEAELHILLDGDELLAIPFVEVRLE